LTLDQIIEETRNWPLEKVSELVGRLTEELHSIDPDIEAAWKSEIDRRLDQIQSGKVKGVPVEEAFSNTKRILGR
jgi:putative addiction module component (TIGR02574 family)